MSLETKNSGVKAMQNQIKPRRRLCPHCGSWEVHGTRWKGLVERCVLYLWGLRPFQCKACYKRFYGRPAPQPGTATETGHVYSSENAPNPVQRGIAFRAKV